MKEGGKRLNIFIDESGDFGFTNGSSRLYDISFTLHESNNSITADLNYLNTKLRLVNYKGMIHLADLVAKRGDYANFSLDKRKAIFWSIFYFSKRVNVKLNTIIIDKKYLNTSIQLKREITTRIADFFYCIKDYMEQFQKVVIYYDNGQKSLGDIIDLLIKNKNNVEHRVNFNQKEKRLFQVSDILTFIDKIDYKYNNHIPFTKAEKYFFQIKDIIDIKRKLKNKRL